VTPLPLTGIVLAAGLSRRAAPHHKLLLPGPDGSGRTVVRATVEAMCGAGLSEILVVTGHEREAVEAALAGTPVRFVFAAGYAQGMGASLAAGVRAAGEDGAGLLVTPGDLPALTPALVGTIARHFAGLSFTHHVVPTAGGRRGHPVVLGSWLRTALGSLAADVGARELLAAPPESARCRFFEVGDEAILTDVDDASSAGAR
jgi:molybdenum cofactor cytidylyltransferase